MATLRYSQIRAHPGGTIRYIANKEKMISDRAHDVHNVLNYMGEPESAERVYSFGHHCSTNPELAEKQMQLYRARYFAGKKGGVQGLAEDGQELLGLHFFLSYTEADNPSEATMNDIVQKIAEHPKLKDFPLFASNHYDKKHKHSHFYVSQYSAEGKPRKLCMRSADYDDIRRYMNRLCVERGLSVIDLASLRRDPEYSEWLDGVIAEGKVIVHPEKEEHKRSSKQKVETKRIYYRWMKEQEEAKLAEEKKLTEAELKRKRTYEKYYFSVDGKTPHPMSAYNGKKYYATSLYAPDGRRRSTLELLILLIAAIIDGEGRYMKQTDPRVHEAFFAKPNYRIQGMLDSISTAREMNIEKPSDVAVRLADVGKQMNALNQEKRRHEASIKKHKEILAAYETYERLRPLVGDPCEAVDGVLADFNSAYATLAANQCLTADAHARLQERYKFELRKVSDYEKRLPELKKQYRDLKRIEVMAYRPMETVNEVYRYSADARDHRKPSLSEQVSGAESRAAKQETQLPGMTFVR